MAIGNRSVEFPRRAWRVAPLVVILAAIAAFTPSTAAQGQSAQQLADSPHDGGVEERLEAIRLRYYRARDAIGLASALDATTETEITAMGGALPAAWHAVEEWACTFIEREPNAGGRDLAARIESLDPPEDCGETYSPCFEHRHLDASAERLDDRDVPAWVVAVNYPQGGTLAILALDTARGSCRAVWHPADAVAHLHDASEPLSCLAGEPHPCRFGPLGSTVRALPPTGRGDSRFWVDSWRAGVGGCEYYRQATVWHWTGREVGLEVATGYAASCNATSPPIFDPSTNVLTLITKQYAKTFFTAGVSPDPEGERRLRIGPWGVDDLGTYWRVPELELIDDLLDRVARDAPANDIASAGVQRRLVRFLGLGGRPVELRVGFGGGSVLRREGSRTEFCFHGDDLFAVGGTSLLFTLVPRGGHLYAESVRTTRASCW